MSVTVAPHGLWKSPITGNSFTARSVTLSQVRVDGPDTYWVEGHPLEGPGVGRSCAVGAPVRRERSCR